MEAEEAGEEEEAEEVEEEVDVASLDGAGAEATTTFALAGLLCVARGAAALRRSRAGAMDARSDDEAPTREARSIAESCGEIESECRSDVSFEARWALAMKSARCPASPSFFPFSFGVLKILWFTFHPLSPNCARRSIPLSLSLL